MWVKRHQGEEEEVGREVREIRSGERQRDGGSALYSSWNTEVN